MLRSMTAFGRASGTYPLGRFTVEIQSVNRKFLEVQVWAPQELAVFEVPIKKWVGERVTRGSLQVRVSCSFEERCPVHVEPNLALARQVGKAAEALAGVCGITDVQGLTAHMLARHRDILTVMTYPEEESAYEAVLREMVGEALNHLVEMKDAEGRALGADFLERIQGLRTSMATIEAKAPEASLRYRERLRGRLEELIPGVADNEERVLREICIYSEKVDIVEEIVRFRYHLEHLENLLQDSSMASGKKVDFILQELNREITTIASKSSDVTVSHEVVVMKSELERMREQIQNVE